MADYTEEHNSGVFFESDDAKLIKILENLILKISKEFRKRRKLQTNSDNLPKFQNGFPVADFSHARKCMFHSLIKYLKSNQMK